MSEHSIGKTIANLRKAKCWTQVELAEKLNVSDKAISKWESEVGLPEISQFPALSELFGVSIDYLMMGKTPEKEIIVMSKTEFCAKNDDVELFDKLVENASINGTDEDGHSLVFYLVKYKSKRVIERLFEKVII
ncbi:MAG: helix-turn-helix domain-containing protein, partial [Eubacteriales bacterium]